MKSLTMTSTDRLAALKGKAEDVAMSLIRNQLEPTEPRYAPLCQRLARFKPLLTGQHVEEAQARQLLKNGFAVVKIELDPQADDDTEVLRLLVALAEKLGGMAGMFGI